MEILMICECGYSWGRKFKGSVVLALFKKNEVSVAMIKSCNNNDLIAYICDGYFGSKLFIVKGGSDWL